MLYIRDREMRDWRRPKTTETSISMILQATSLTAAAAAQASPLSPTKQPPSMMMMMAAMLMYPATMVVASPLSFIHSSSKFDSVGAQFNDPRKVTAKCESRAKHWKPFCRSTTEDPAFVSRSSMIRLARIVLLLLNRAHSESYAAIVKLSPVINFARSSLASGSAAAAIQLALSIIRAANSSKDCCIGTSHR